MTCFHDFMVDCRESKNRYRHDQVNGRWVEAKGQKIWVAADDPTFTKRAHGKKQSSAAQVLQPPGQKR